ncbi:MAG: hypothetical protein MJA29_01525, partial [Candidatus Omnitrophica bacterium]|nr:hypothetical protein [Candidatus Omnitrophota bacterium]
PGISDVPDMSNVPVMPVAVPESSVSDHTVSDPMVPSLPRSGNANPRCSSLTNKSGTATSSSGGATPDVLVVPPTDQRKSGRVRGNPAWHKDYVFWHKDYVMSKK